MAEHSSIEWTDATWNPITGCSVVSPGCTNCYAMKLAGTRLRHHPSRSGLTINTKAGPVWNGKVRLNEEWIDQPLKWKRPRMIFVCAHGDLFHEDVPDSWIDRVFAIMALAPQHTFQVLTKRAERMHRYMLPFEQRRADSLGKLVLSLGYTDPLEALEWPLPNVWFGVSAEDQQRADERIPHLLATPATFRFLSAEPLLGPIDFYTTSSTMPNEEHPWRNGPILQGIDWVIVGGESGSGARPMHPEWARSMRDQCASADVPFFFKQWGNWAAVSQMSEEQIDACYPPLTERHPDATRAPLVSTHVLHADGSRHHTHDRDAFLQGTGAMTMFEIGKKRAGRLLDSIEHNGMPRLVLCAGVN